MFEVLFNTFTYLLLIAIGYFLKKRGIIGPQGVDTVMALVVNLTLPCLLITSAAGVAMTPDMVLYLVLGLMVSVLAIGMSLFLSRRNTTGLMRGVCMMSSAGIDVGNFVLPFIQTFFPGLGVMILSVFNIGNTIMNSGVNYALATKIVASQERYGIKDILRKLFTSMPFDAYMLILFMAVTRLPWPERFLHVTGVIANANIFLVMIMIGLKMEFKLEYGERGFVARILTVRFAVAILLTALVWMLPIDQLPKVVMTAAFFGPPASVTNVFVKQLGYKGSLASQINVITIFTAMAIITGLMMVFAV